MSLSKLESAFAFRLAVALDPAEDHGTTRLGDRRFIPISGGEVTGPKLQGRILPGGGDWNLVREDGTVEVWARYTIETANGVKIGVTNKGIGRASRAQMAGVFGPTPASHSGGGGAAWYTRTCPEFEVRPGEHDWLLKSLFVGVLLPPTRPGQVVIDMYEIL